MKRSFCISIIILLSVVSFVMAQPKLSTLQSVFLYSALKYMEWPKSNNGDFMIEVIGESEIYEELQKIAKTRKFGSKSLVIKQINSIEELGDPQIVFLTTANHNLLEKLNNSLGGNPVLVITERDGLIKKGSDLNFVQRGDRLNFQINEATIKKKGIKVSGEFVTLAEKN